MEKYTVSQVSGLSGVSIRTLHYYDDIGLLKPAETTDAGYRLYSGSELSRLQEILFLKELDFDLKEIGAVMSMPQHDGEKALSRQKAMLLAKIERLNRLISVIDNRMKGESQVSFSEFDMKKMEEHKAKYKREA
jgi:DNA-binding transcriptional MerR regulator